MAGALRCAPYEDETLAAVAGARVVYAAAVSVMINSTRPLVLPVLLDVGGGDRLRSIPEAVWLPDAGLCDRASPRLQAGRFEAPWQS